ncbi:MAG: 4'-phosphopantetheinyl transferase superfamily protein [Acidobacteriaceae bacterium]
MNPQIFHWPGSSRIPQLDSGEIHVWALDLDRSPMPSDWGVLGHDETVHAHRFVFPRDRDRYVRAHAAMRILLGAYTGRPAAEIFFSHTAYGKPEIAPGQNSPHVRFNLSHSGGVGVFAASCGHELGVDIEMVRAIDRDVAEHHFSARELLTLSSLPPEDWRHGFFRCWTSKEALLKGAGMGLNLPLDAFDVEADPKRSPALLDFRGPASLASGWRLTELNPAPNVVGTLAARGEGRGETAHFNFPEVRLFAFNG